MKWFSVSIHRNDDPEGLMVVEVKGKDQDDAEQRLASVLLAEACVVIYNTWADLG